MNNKFVIHLAGRSCSGKSTVAELLSQRLPGIFTVDYDHIKWQLAGYQSDKHRPIIEAIATDMYTSVCQHSLPVLLKLFSHNQATFDSFKETARKYGYKFIPIYLTAPDEVLLARFRKRVLEYKEKGLKISITDENVFKSWLAADYFQSPEAKVFDTSKIAVAEIVDQVIKMI